MHKWVEIARKDEAAGVAEIPGGADHPRIVEYNRYVKYGTPGDDEAWCAKCVNAWFEEAGIKGTNSARARWFETWGVALHSPIPGCVVVYWRGNPNSGSGHVHLYEREDETHIYGRGGNQSNKVCVAPYEKDRVLCFRWPAGIPIPEPEAEQGVMIAMEDARALREKFAETAKLLQEWADELGEALEGVA